LKDYENSSSKSNEDAKKSDVSAIKSNASAKTLNDVKKRQNDSAIKSNASAKTLNDVKKRQNDSAKKSNNSAKTRNDVKKRQNASAKKTDITTNRELERPYYLSFLTLIIPTSLWVSLFNQTAYNLHKAMP
jgi:hypothetical protein